MKLTNEQLKAIYHGALWYQETEEGYLQAFQYTKEQNDYFEKVSEFWFERCTASTAKTLEFTTAATSCSFEYKFLWVGSEDSVELWIDGQAAEIRYVKEMEKEVKEDESFYNLSRTLIKYFKYFVDIDDEFVPEDSLLREFIGGSIYEE